MNSGGREFRVCMISDDFLPGKTGVGTHLQSVVRALGARGHDVSVITTRRRGQEARETWHGATVHRTRSLAIVGYYQSLATRGEVRRLLEMQQPQIVHFHYLSMLLINALSATTQLGLKRLMTYHFPPDVLMSPWFMRPFKGLAHRAHVHYANQFDAILSPSRNLIGSLRDQGIRAPMEYLSNPLPKVEPADALPARRDGSFVVMFAGRLAPEKNIPLLLGAVARLTREVPNAELWIAGEGELRRELEKEAHALGIGERTSFLGQLSRVELANRYSAADVFVLPSLIETQGLVLMEAMGYAKPVIATTKIIPGPEMVEHGVNGFLVDVDTPAPLAQRLAELARAPDLRRQMGAAGQLRCEEFAEDKVIAGLEAVYSRLLARP